MQRKKLTLLPRSGHPAETISAPQSGSDETHPARTNPFGAARPVDTDSALKKVEEKLAREKHKEHKEEPVSAKHSITSESLPAKSPVQPDVSQQSKRPLRRPPPAPSSTAPDDNTKQPDPRPPKSEDETSHEDPAETSWRKITTTTSTVKPATADEGEDGWATVPVRGRRSNGTSTGPGVRQ
jgi:translation initiation factor 4B